MNRKFRRLLRRGPSAFQILVGRWRLRFNPRHLEDLILGGRLSLAAVLAMVLAKILGIHAFYWAGISAIVVSTGTPWGSVSTSLSRFGGTLAGLSTGVCMVMLFGHSLLSVAMAVPLAIVVCRLAGLRGAMKLAALTTLFPVLSVTEVQHFGPTLAIAFSRAMNVLVGCSITILVDALLWPENISRKFLRQLQEVSGRICAFASGEIQAYLEGRSGSGAPDLAQLQHARLEHLRLAEELASEPEDSGIPKAFLLGRMEEIHGLIDLCSSLHAVLPDAREDQVQALIREDLALLAESIRRAGPRLEAGDPRAPEVQALASSRQHLETAFQRVREHQGTLAYPAPEVLRLLNMIFLGSNLAKGLARFGEKDPGLAEEA